MVIYKETSPFPKQTVQNHSRMNCRSRYAMAMCGIEQGYWLREMRGDQNTEGWGSSVRA